VEAAGIEPAFPTTQRAVATTSYATTPHAWLQSQDTDEHDLARIGTIIEAWPTLPEHIKLTIETLCRQVRVP